MPNLCGAFGTLAQPGMRGLGRMSSPHLRAWFRVFGRNPNHYSPVESESREARTRNRIFQSLAKHARKTPSVETSIGWCPERSTFLVVGRYCRDPSLNLGIDPFVSVSKLNDLEAFLAG